MKSFVVSNKSNLLFGLASLLLSSSEISAKEVKIANLSVIPPMLGQGYDSKTGKLRQVCVEGKLTYSGQQTSKIDFQKTQSVDEINNKVSASIKGGVDLVLVAASAKSKLTSTMSYESNISKYFLSAEILGKKAILSNFRLNSLGRKALETGGINTFKAICGDRFVSSLDMGMIYIFGVLARYRDEATKNRLEVIFRVKTPLGSLKKKKSREWDTEKEFASISFDMYQVGGDQGFYDEIKNRYKSKNCKEKGLEHCFAKAEKYLNEILEHSRFLSQTNPLQYNQTKPDRNAVLASYVSGYQNANLLEIKPAPFKKLSYELSELIQAQAKKRQTGFKTEIDAKEWFFTELEVSEKLIECRGKDDIRC